MASEVLVSVIIPTYNRLAYLREAVESVLNQTHSNLEIIVIDDGSTDGTGEAIRAIDSDKIRYVRQEHRGRPAPARNVGLREAAGEFIAFLDSDDQWLPEKIERQLRAFDENPKLDLVATDFFHIPDDRQKPALGLKRPQRVTFRDLLRKNPIANSSVLMRRSAVMAIGLQDESRELRGLEDYDYWLRVLREGSECAIILAEPLMLYRRHDGNIGIQNAEQVDRLSAIARRHRDFDETYVDSVLEELKDRRAFRQALTDVDQGSSSLIGILFRREVRFTDRLRLIKQRVLRLKRGGRPRG